MDPIEYDRYRMVPVYRHGMAYDALQHHQVYYFLYGGLDASFTRYNSQLWTTLDLTTNVCNVVAQVVVHTTT